MENQDKNNTQFTSRPPSSHRSSLHTNTQERNSTSTIGKLTPHLRGRTPINNTSKSHQNKPRMTSIRQNKETKQEDYQNPITPQLITLNKH